MAINKTTSGTLHMEYNAALFSVLGIITILIIGGNLITIGIILRSQRLRNTTGYLMVSLASADTGVGLTTAIPLLQYLFSDLLDPRECDFIGFVNSVTWVVSVYTLVALSLDRFIAIVYPLQFNDILTKKRCAIVVSCIWSLSIILWLIPLCGVGGFKFNDEELACYFDVAKFPAQWISYNALIFIPSSTTITAVYLKIWGISKRHAQQIADVAVANDPTNEGFKRNRKAAMTLLIIVLAFYIAWIPFTIEHIVKAALGSLENIPEWLEILIYVLAVSNSFWNPIIYMGTNKNFRNSAFALFRKCCPSFFDQAAVAPDTNHTTE